MGHVRDSSAAQHYLPQLVGKEKDSWDDLGAMTEGQLDRPGMDAKGEFVGPISDTLNKALRFEDALQEGSELRKRLDDPKTDPHDIWELQLNLYGLVQQLDSDIKVSDAMNNLKSLTQVSLAGVAGFTGIVTAIWAGSLAPLGVAIKDPEKRFNYNRDAHEQEAADRAELRSAVAKVHAYVTAKLKSLKHDDERFAKLPDPPQRVKHWSDARPE